MRKESDAFDERKSSSKQCKFIAIIIPDQCCKEEKQRKTFKKCMKIYIIHLKLRDKYFLDRVIKDYSTFKLQSSQLTAAFQFQSDLQGRVKQLYYFLF